MQISAVNTKNQNELYFQNANKTQNNLKNKSVSKIDDDLFEIKSENEEQENEPEKGIDKSNNGKFDASEAGKNFLKGILSPLTAVIKHPVITLATIGITAAACALVPVLGPILGIGFGALSIFQLGKGCTDVVKNIKNKEYDKAEQSFNNVGQGTVGTVLSVLGLKQSAKVAKEAKLMNELKVNSLSSAQKEAIAAEVKNGSYLDALKDNVSLFTSRTGLKAAVNQFKPSNIFQRGKNLIKHLFTKKEVTKIEKEQMNFSETTEGQRRAALTTEEIEAQVKALAKEAFDEYGVPEELRPEIKIIKDNTKLGGAYQCRKHTIVINEDSYRAGVFDLPNVIKHEATHANGAILRQSLPMDKKIELAQEYLINKIQNGEKEKIITGGNIFGAYTSKPPKLNAQMKSDFIKLAKDKLYKEGTIYTNEELSAMVKPLVEANSEFANSYSNIDDAVNAMAAYAKSHNLRYNIALRNPTGFNTSNVDTSLLKQLNSEETQAAMKSYLDSIECVEGNIAGQGFMGIGGDVNQYQFCNEEVLAQIKGNNFEISKLEQQLNALRNQPKRNLSEEARILDLIEEAKLTIEYKTKGVDYYKLYIESLNHPENKELAAKAAGLKKELDAIQQKMLTNNKPVSTDVLGSNVNVTSTEYKTKTVLKRPETGASIAIPVSATTAADIIADKIA